jgi:hypothetical protein
MHKWEEADSWYWKYTCASCVAERDACTLGEAQIKCHKSQSFYDKKVERDNKFKMAKLHAIEEFPSYTGKEIRNIVRASLLIVLQPLAKYIIRKSRVLEKRSELMQKHAEVLLEFESIQDSKDLKRGEELLSQLEQIMEEVDDTERPLAFRERAEKELPNASPWEQEKRQWQYFTAATYSDLWAEVKDKSGNVIGYFMSFYTCMNNMWAKKEDGEWELRKCGTIICSKIWDRLHDDPLATGQRYYCRCCKGRYWTRYGTMLQILIPGQMPAFLRASVPPTDNEDVKAMYLEEEINPDSPEDLYFKIPHAVPHADGTFIRPATQAEMYDQSWSPYGSFRILKIEEFEAMPLWHWEQMFSMFQEGK